MDKKIENIINEISKSQANAKNILETFAFENNINLDFNNKKKISKFIEEIKKEEINIELFNSLLGKLK